MANFLGHTGAFKFPAVGAALAVLSCFVRLEICIDAAGVLNVEPDLLLAGREEELRFSSSLVKFPSKYDTYELLLQQPGSMGAASSTIGCSWESRKAVRCKATWPTSGALIAVLRANATDVGVVALSAYVQAIVSRITPSSLTLAGGTLVQVSFSKPLPQYGSVILRLVHEQGTPSVNIDIALSVDEDGLVASGRSPAAPLGMSSGSSVQVFLSLNGKSFVATGQASRFVAKTPLKVGFVLVGTPQDFGWNFQHNFARLMIEDRFYGQVETVYKEYVSEWGPNMCDFCADLPGWNASKKLGMWNDEPDNYFGTHESAMVMRKWIEEEGVRMIFTTSWFFHWDTFHMAGAYPHLHFVHASGYLTRPNMATVFPKVYQARYLSGIAMGWYIKKHDLKKRVGYVSAFPVGETVRHINAFKLGLEQVDPEIEVYLTWLFTWHNERKERIGASRLFKYYDVVGMAQHTDSREPQIVAREYEKVGIGYNTDMLFTVGDSVLTSPVLVWSEDYAKLVQKVLDGDENFGEGLWNGAETGSWRLSDFSPLVPVEAKIQIAEEQAKFLKGQDDIFCKPGLRDNKGRARNDLGQPNPTVNPPPWEANHLVPGTTCLTDPVVSMSCAEYQNGDCKEFWFVEGVRNSCEGMPDLPGLPPGTCFLGGMDLPDKCPDGEHLMIQGCTNAAPGFFARDEKEFPCALGFAAPVAGMTSCDICQAATAAGHMNSTSCEPCQPGFYAQEAGMSECAQCPRGQYSEGLRNSVCSPCKADTYADDVASVACKACPAGRSTRLMAATSEADCVCAAGTADVDGVCQPCGEGIACDIGTALSNWESVMSSSDNKSSVGSYPKAEKGYYATKENPLEAFYCMSDTACPGGDPGTCGSMRHKLACGECVDGYVTFGHDDCLECDMWKPWRFFLIMVLSPVMVLLAYKFMNYPFETVFELRRKIQHSLFLILIYLQMIALVNDFDLDFPQGMQSVGLGLQLLNINLDVLRPACGFGEDFVAGYVMKLLVPFFCVVAFTATYVACWGISVAMKNDMLALDVPKLHNVFLSFLNTFYIGLTRLATSVFQCYEHPSGKRSMLSAPHVLCDGDGDGTWTSVVPISVLAMLVYTVGIFLLFGYANFRAPERFHEPRFRRRWLFLLTKFRPDFWWWDQLLLLKGLALNLTAMMFSSTSSRAFWVMLVQLSYAMGIFLIKPWRHSIANVVDTIVTFSMVAVLALGLWFTSNLKVRWIDELTDAYTIWLFIFVCLPPILVLNYFFFILFRFNRQRAETRDYLQFASRLRTVFSWVLNEDPASFNSFLMRLTDEEFSCLRKTRDVLVSELFRQQPSRFRFQQRICMASTDHQVVNYEQQPLASSESGYGEEVLDGLRNLRYAIHQDEQVAGVLGIALRKSRSSTSDMPLNDNSLSQVSTSASSEPPRAKRASLTEFKLTEARWDEALQEIDSKSFGDQGLRHEMFKLLDIKKRGYLEVERLLGVLDSLEEKVLEPPVFTPRQGSKDKLTGKDMVDRQDCATWMSEQVGHPAPQFASEVESTYSAAAEGRAAYPGKLVIPIGVTTDHKQDGTYNVTPRDIVYTPR